MLAFIARAFVILSEQVTPNTLGEEYSKVPCFFCVCLYNKGTINLY